MALVFLLLLFAAFGAAAMVCTRRDFSWPATKGILLAAVAGTAAIFSGLAGWMSPEFPEGRIRWVFVSLLVVIVLIGLAHERRGT